MDRGLVTSWIHQSPISTPLNTHRYLVHARLIRGSLRGVRNPDQCPHLHHRTLINKVPWVPATPTGWPRLPRRPSGGKWVKELAWRDRRNGNRGDTRAGWPCPPGMGSHTSHFRAGPPLHRGCALGGKLARDLGRGIGGEGEEVGRERDRRQGFANPVARHYLVFRELDGQVQRRRAVALDPLLGLLRQPCNDLLQQFTSEALRMAFHQFSTADADRQTDSDER